MMDAIVENAGKLAEQRHAVKDYILYARSQSFRGMTARAPEQQILDAIGVQRDDDHNRQRNRNPRDGENFECGQGCKLRNKTRPTKGRTTPPEKQPRATTARTPRPNVGADSP